MKKYKLFVIYSILLLGWQGKIENKVINIRNSKITIEIPVSCKIDNKYPRYSDYSLKYGVQYSNNKTASKLTVNVYDSSRLDSNKITKSLIEFYKESLQRFYGKNIRFVDERVKKLDNNNEIGVLKYQYTIKDGVDRYGINFFFRGPKNEFYEGEIVSYIIPKQSFQKVADRIFNSLKLDLSL